MFKGYLSEDSFKVLTELNRIHRACVQGIKMGEKADFVNQEEVMSELSYAFENLKSLHHKKIDSEITDAANEEIRRLVL